MGRRQKSAAHSRSPNPVRANGQPSLLAYLRGVLGSINPTARPIAELKRNLGASVGSIVAFCRQRELEGIVDFKIALARDLAQSGRDCPPRKRGRAGRCSTGSSLHAQSLLDTLRFNTPAPFEKAAHAIGRARTIQSFSIDLSNPVAYTAYCKFQLLGLSASASPMHTCS